jgi:serine/threonine protein kinase
VEQSRKLYEKILSIDYHHADVADRLRSLTAQAGNTSGMRAIGSDSTGQRWDGQTTSPPNISGRLEVIRKLGQGRHAAVFEGYDRVLQRKVAVKRYPAAASERPDMVSRFQREAQKAAQLSHPNLVTVLGVGEDHEGRYILEELVVGKTLREVLDEKIRLEPARVVEMATQACEVLGYAHRNAIIHRDLRPENVFLVGEDLIKISDFGLKARMTDPDAIAGQSVCYLAPEALRSERVDARSDIYSLGVIIYELMLGEPPFPADTASFDHINTEPSFPRKVDRPMPAFLRKLIAKCLEKDRAKRYKNAAQVLDELKASAIVPGTVIADRYQIVRELGLGGMGRIYQALDRDLDEQVALKVLRVSEGDQSPMERFLREVKMARRISHPNVVKVYDLGSWKEHRYITMEYIDGINLEQWVRLRSKLDLEAALKLTVDIAGGIASAHALGIIHRDVKPQNILLQDGVVPKILDFGIACSAGVSDLTTAGFVMGSPKYMSPEQVQALPLDARSDIYSLGVLMYFIFTGREPFVGDTPAVIAHKHIGEHARPPRELNPAIPAWLEGVILRTMSKNRDERHASMNELIAALESGIASQAMMQGGGEPT